MLCEVPLTKEQQEFAAEHHGLVYKFLNDNHLPEDEFYDVVIFFYFYAVKDYWENLSSQAYSFSTIANRQMKFCLYDYLRAQTRQKRNAEVVSIHFGPCSNGLSPEDVMPAQDTLMLDLEMRLLLHDLAGRVSQQQMKIVRMKSCGYGIREIASREKIPMKRIKEVLEEVRLVVLEMCCE